jgi:glutathione synthase/RimK-type ligase-like ATP-grasp enzyme
MTASRSIVLVTCERWPNLYASDQALADELAARGHTVRVRSWNGAPVTAFAEAETVVLRANWDFHHDLSGFTAWLAAVECSDAVLLNPAPLVRDYLDKSYLTRLQRLGLPTPATLLIEDLDDTEVDRWLEEHSINRLVLKPAWGASGHGVELISIDELDVARNRWRSETDRRHVIVQEFAPAIHDGERSLVFFEGTYSHALLRSTGSGEFRINSKYGGTMSLATDIDASMIELGERVAATFSVPATYARIDMVGRGDDLVLMEVEVNEPALGLDLAPGSAAAFADAILAAASP